MRRIKVLSVNSGFTLVELMVALVVAGIVAIATYSSYRLQVKTAAGQDAVSQMQQNLRAGLDILLADLRMAGYDPTDSGNFTFVNNATFSNGASTPATETVYTDATRIAFTKDLDSDGTVDKAAEDVNSDLVKDMSEMEQVAYRLNNMQLERYSTTSGVIEWQDVAENIEAIEFRYTLADGTQTLTPNTAVQLAAIRSVQISILARAEQRDPGYKNTNEYAPASGIKWDLSGDPDDGTNIPNDNYRRRLLITTIDCRNMGI